MHARISADDEDEDLGGQEELDVLAEGRDDLREATPAKTSPSKKVDWTRGQPGELTMMRPKTASTMTVLTIAIDDGGRTGRRVPEGDPTPGATTAYAAAASGSCPGLRRVPHSRMGTSWSVLIVAS